MLDFTTRLMSTIGIESHIQHFGDVLKALLSLLGLYSTG